MIVQLYMTARSILMDLLYFLQGMIFLKRIIILFQKFQFYSKPLFHYQQESCYNSFLFPTCKKWSNLYIPYIKNQEEKMILAKFFGVTLPSQPQHQSPQTQPEAQPFPPNMASLITDLQIECDGQHICQDLIISLINLYTDSIEYYEEVDAYKAAIYKKRLQNFLSKNSVSSVLQGKDSNLISKKEIVERSRIEATVNSKEMANRLIEKYEKSTDLNKKVIQKDLKCQQENLQARITRRKSMSNKSANSDNDDFDFQVAPQIKKGKKMSVNLILSDIKSRNIKRVFV